MLVFIGMRGAGKSTVGRLVASAIGNDFIDLDDETARVLGCQNASEALARWGLAAFRGAEWTALQMILKERRGVAIALGGGTLTIEGSRELIRGMEGVWVVHLRASAEELQSRLRADAGGRPGLTGPDPVAEVPDLLVRREPVYRGVMDVEVETDGRTPQQVAEAVLRSIPIRIRP